MTTGNGSASSVVDEGFIDQLSYCGHLEKDAVELITEL